MTTQNTNDAGHGFHYEDGVPILNTQLDTIEYEQAEAKKRDEVYRDEQLTLSPRMMQFTGLLVLTSVISGSLIWWQAHIANKSALAAESAAKTASETLWEIQHGSGTADTHTLAMQAITQATQTTAFAKAEIAQAVQTQKIAQATILQVATAQKIETLHEAETLPYIVLQGMDLTEPIIPGKLTKVSNSFINEGGSVALDVQSLSRSDSIVDGTTPPFEFKVFTGSRSSIGAKNTFDSPIYIGPQTPIQVQQISMGVRKIYVTGEIIYSDFTHKIHHTFYCMELDPRSGNMNGCKYQKRSD